MTASEMDTTDYLGIAEALSYAASHGIIVSQAKNSAIGTNLSHAPMTYRPTPLHRPCYHHAIDITNALNTVVYRIAHNHTYLRESLAETASADAEFTGRLLALLDNAPTKPSVELGIFRYDYFVHEQSNKKELRMVEMNCIAASFGCLSTKTSEMHRFLSTHPTCNFNINTNDLPQNDATTALTRTFSVAHKEYLKLHNISENRSTGIAMIVQPGERNAYDQDILRSAVWESAKILMIRVTLEEINQYGVLEDGHLVLRLPSMGYPVLITISYYRAGYTPDDYPSEKQWMARGLIESSLAAKCPSAAVQLVGTKKIQQILDKPGEIERFVDRAEDAAAIRATFAAQYSLSTADGGDEVAKMGIERSGDFVLKPQREGGGNNIYSQEMKEALQTMTAEERSAYVLMERIRPVVVKGTLLRDGRSFVVDIVSEFGVYGVHVITAGKDVENGSAGTLLRSKSASQDDGGVAAGVAVLDSPVLVD